MYQYVIANDGCASTERRVVFDGYVNGDILFGTDFVRTLTKIGEVFAPRIGTGTGRGVMVIGMRFNKNIQESTVIDTEEKLVEFSKSATPFQPDAQDYFIFSRGGVDWTKEIAHFVVGSHPPPPFALRPLARAMRALLAPDSDSGPCRV
eukprot:3688944-Rhodomonas_salina.2